MLIILQRMLFEEVRHNQFELHIFWHIGFVACYFKCQCNFLTLRFKLGVLFGRIKYSFKEASVPVSFLFLSYTNTAAKFSIMYLDVRDRMPKRITSEIENNSWHMSRALKSQLGMRAFKYFTAQENILIRIIFKIFKKQNLLLLGE